MRSWEKIVPAEDIAIMASGGFGERLTMGTKPALLIIDVVESFTGSKPTGVTNAQQEYRTACGDVAWEALPKIRTLLHACRNQNLPVIYTKGDPEFKDWCGSSTKGWSRGEGKRLHTTPIPDIIKPQEDEFILRKTKASAFFGTPLMIYLNRLGIDTLFIVGTATSGCVRATVIDGFSYGFKQFLVEDGCFDRTEFAHLSNLFDIDCKYADVISLEEALTMVAEVERPAARR